MSVVFQSEVGQVLDHRQWIVNTYHQNNVMDRVPSRGEDHSMFPFQEITKEDPHELSLPKSTLSLATRSSPSAMIPLASHYSSNTTNALMFKSGLQETCGKLLSNISDKNSPNLPTNSPRKTDSLSYTTCTAVPADVGLMSRDAFRVTAKYHSDCSPDTGGNCEGVQPRTASTPNRDGCSLPGPETAPLLQLFDLRTPFLMDGAARKVAERMRQQTVISPQPVIDEQSPYPREETGAKGPEDSGSKASRQRKKKRRVCHTAGDGIDERPTGDTEESGRVLSMFRELQRSEHYQKLFPLTPTAEDYLHNNAACRDAAARVLDSTAAPLPTGLPVSGGNPSQKNTVLRSGDQRFLLPPRCKYWAGDATALLARLPPGQQYKVVVMDPPWWNKHIRRSKKARGHHHGYGMMPVEAILQLPLRSLLRSDAAVLVWATNSYSTVHQFKAGLETAWGLVVVNTCFWVKVTRHGELIRDVASENGHGKLPYERLLVAIPIQRIGKQLYPERTETFPKDISLETNPKYDQNSLQGEEKNDGSCSNSSNQADKEIREDVLVSRGDNTFTHTSLTSSSIMSSVLDESRFSPSRGSTLVECPPSKAVFSIRTLHSTHPSQMLSSSTSPIVPLGTSPSPVAGVVSPGLLLVSTPSALHSHKPPLDDLLRHLSIISSGETEGTEGEEEEACLEVFARSLVPRWHSVGLEVLRLQHCHLYEQTQLGTSE